jgi:site-specific DNA-methyltransferase (adenine-specific)
VTKGNNNLGQLIFHSSEYMREVCDVSARLVIASPPYTNNCDEKKLDKKEYISFLREVFSESFRILIPGSILVCVNTDLRDHGRYNRGNRSFEGQLWFKHCDIRKIAEEIGFRCFDCKIWAKTLNRDVMRYTFSYIVFYSKPGAQIHRPLYPRVADGFGPDVWLLEKGTRRKSSDGHVFRDAIHPSIVERCIAEFTLPGDLVVSPFAGSGTILAVAELMDRVWIGYEVNKTLKDLIWESVYGPKRPKVYKHLVTKYQSKQEPQSMIEGKIA